MFLELLSSGMCAHVCESGCPWGVDFQVYPRHFSEWKAGGSRVPLFKGESGCARLSSRKAFFSPRVFFGNEKPHLRF